jgi:hypothetical protein
MFDLHSLLGVFSLLLRKYIIKHAKIPGNRKVLTMKTSALILGVAGGVIAIASVVSALLAVGGNPQYQSRLWVAWLAPDILLPGAHHCFAHRTSSINH